MGGATQVELMPRTSGRNATISPCASLSRKYQETFDMSTSISTLHLTLPQIFKGTFNMPLSRRKLQSTVEETLFPPDQLKEGQHIARIQSGAGNNLYNVELGNQTSMLVELEARFRSTIWLKRGGYVLIDTTTLADRDNKIDGEIVNVVRDEKAWRKAPFWPKEFTKRAAVHNASDDEESNIGKMPPSDSGEDV